MIKLQNILTENYGGKGEMVLPPNHKAGLKVVLAVLIVNFGIKKNKYVQVLIIPSGQELIKFPMLQMNIVLIGGNQ